MSLSRFEKNVLSLFQESPDSVYKVNQVAQRLNYKGSKNYKKLIKALAFLERINELTMNDKGQFQLKHSNQLIEGIYRANEKGFGFITYDEKLPDLFIPRGSQRDAMDGDTVEARIIKEVNPVTGKGSEAKIQRVLKRAESQLVGVFTAFNQLEREKTGFLGYVKPYDYSESVHVYIQSDGGIRPVDESVCIVKITQYPTKEKPNELVGLVAKEIGHKNAPGVDIQAILYKFGIPHEFPEIVIEEANQVPQEITQEELKDRVDLRNELIITIDGADAKDLDDAVTVSKNPDGSFRLGVHIADVSHYVKDGSAIDREALERGNSVYLTDRVVPMLPQRLSNGICSLHPNEDRLTMSCEMIIDQNGNLVNDKQYLSVIKSKYRMTYHDVNEILEGDKALREEYSDLVTMLEEMAQLHKILEAKRKRRGALNFDFPESKIIVDEEGHPIDIQLRERKTAEKMIESFMLAANETIARKIDRQSLPFLYRIHEQPDPEKMTRFAEFITSFGIILRGNIESIQPKQLQVALEKTQNKPFHPAVSTMLLRSMQQAKYSDEPTGHYGLAATDYTHFTSPIRRYPDLMIHRLMHRYLVGRPSQGELNVIEKRLPYIAEHSSKMERRAIDAERETDSVKKTEYMADKVGEVFEGVISLITSFGMFVALPNTIEGLIRMDSMKDDYYIYHENHLILIGERTGKIFRIGQKVEVECIQVDVEQRQIDFELVSSEDMDTSDLKHLKINSKRKRNRKKSSQTKRGQKSLGKPKRRQRQGKRRGRRKKR